MEMLIIKLQADMKSLKAQLLMNNLEPNTKIQMISEAAPEAKTEAPEAKVEAPVL